MSFPSPNTDESLATGKYPFIGNFHKTLPHNEFGEVCADAYRKFKSTCLQVEAGAPVNFEEMPKGPVAAPFACQSDPVAQVQTGFISQPGDTGAIEALRRSAARFTSPLAGAATETLGPDPKALDMPPASGCQSLSAAAEMAELYWMALLRDAPLVAFQNQASSHGGCASIDAHNVQLGYDVANRINQAVAAVNILFDCAVLHDQDSGRLRAPLDIGGGPGGANINKQTLFRTGLHDEEFGPLVSQFFIRPVGYGVQRIDQKQTPYIANDRAGAGDKTGPKDPPGGELLILQPGYRKTGSDLEAFCEPQEYGGVDMGRMTVGGELNKLASNVAMGRSMGGVHWRSDNTRSLRLGEDIAIEILRKRTLEYAEARCRSPSVRLTAKPCTSRTVRCKSAESGSRVGDVRSVCAPRWIPRGVFALSIRSVGKGVGACRRRDAWRASASRVGPCAPSRLFKRFSNPAELLGDGRDAVAG